MRILVVSNYYPPHYLGGYELGCRDVVEGLKAKGHQVQVLTSTYGCEGGADTTDAHAARCFRLFSRMEERASKRDTFNAILQDEQHNQAVLADWIARFQPDVAYFWNMGGLSIGLIALAEKRGLPTSFFVSDDWLAKWERGRWHRALHEAWGRYDKALAAYGRLRAAMQRIEMYHDFQPNLSHVQFCSEFLKQDAQQAGRDVANGKVIPWGIHPEQFGAQTGRRQITRLLYVGRLSLEKGVHTAIETLRILVHEQGRAEFTLTLAGGGSDTEYLTRLRDMVQEYKLESQVCFLGAVPRERLADIYNAHGVLLFPSIWGEPFAITPLEAMCSGLVVVGTLNGGSREIFEPNRNALAFPAEDAQECAVQVLRLLRDPELAHAIRERGRALILNRYTMRGMIDAIEQALLEQLGD